MSQTAGQRGAGLRWSQRKLAKGEPSAGAEMTETDAETETEQTEQTTSGGAALTRLVSVTVLCPAVIHGSVFLISFLAF